MSIFKNSNKVYSFTLGTLLLPSLVNWLSSNEVFGKNGERAFTNCNKWSGNDMFFPNGASNWADENKNMSVQDVDNIKVEKSKDGGTITYFPFNGISSKDDIGSILVSLDSANSESSNEDAYAYKEDKYDNAITYAIQQKGTTTKNQKIETKLETEIKIYYDLPKAYLWTFAEHEEIFYNVGTRRGDRQEEEAGACTTSYFPTKIVNTRGLSNLSGVVMKHEPANKIVENVRAYYFYFESTKDYAHNGSAASTLRTYIRDTTNNRIRGTNEITDRWGNKYKVVDEITNDSIVHAYSTDIRKYFRDGDGDKDNVYGITPHDMKLIWNGFLCKDKIRENTTYWANSESDNRKYQKTETLAEKYGDISSKIPEFIQFEVQIKIKYIDTTGAIKYQGTYNIPKIYESTNKAYTTDPDLICMYKPSFDLYKISKELIERWIYLVEHPKSQKMILDAIRKFILEHKELVIANLIERKVQTVPNGVYLNLPIGPPMLSVDNQYALKYKHYYPEYDITKKTVKSIIIKDVSISDESNMSSYLDQVFMDIVKNCFFALSSEKVIKDINDIKKYIFAIMIPSNGRQIFDIIEKPTNENAVIVIDKDNPDDVAKIAGTKDTLARWLLISMTNFSGDSKLSTIQSDYKQKGTFHVPIIIKNDKMFYVNTISDEMTKENIAYVYTNESAASLNKELSALMINYTIDEGKGNTLPSFIRPI